MGASNPIRPRRVKALMVRAAVSAIAEGPARRQLQRMVTVLTILVILGLLATLGTLFAGMLGLAQREAAPGGPTR